MVDIDKLYEQYNKRMDDRARVTAIIDKLLKKHELIFIEMSENPIDEKINKAINERKDFCARINASESLKKNMNLLIYDMEDYVLGLNLHGLECKIKPLEISFEEMSFNSACITNMIRVITNIKEEIEVDEEELLVYAYLLAMADITKRINSLINKEFAGLDQNAPVTIVILRYVKWVIGNKWKEIKKLMLTDGYIKDVYKSFKESYRSELKTRRLMGN